jgi:hypothetical protein
MGRIDPPDGLTGIAREASQDGKPLIQQTIPPCIRAKRP